MTFFYFSLSSSVFLSVSSVTLWFVFFATLSRPAAQTDWEFEFEVERFSIHFLPGFLLLARQRLDGFLRGRLLQLLGLLNRCRRPAERRAGCILEHFVNLLFEVAANLRISNFCVSVSFSFVCTSGRLKERMPLA